MVRFYKMRWGIEVEFRGLKQTLDRAKLRCRNDRRLLAELDWSIMAMAVAELFALKEQLARKPETRGQRARAVDPTRRSLAHAMRAIRRRIRTPDAIPEAGADLPALLREAITDGYQRKKPRCARYRPASPDKKQLGTPRVAQDQSTKRRKRRMRRHEKTSRLNPSRRCLKGRNILLAPLQGFGGCGILIPRAALRGCAAVALPWADMLRPFQGGTPIDSSGRCGRQDQPSVGSRLAQQCRLG